MDSSFGKELKQQHSHFMDAFVAYRDQLTEVLFYGERISRSELTEGKEQVLRSLRSQIQAVQNTLLPAVTSADGEAPVNGIELFADVQQNLLSIADRTEENVDFFANPDAPKDERNDAARETLKDLYRLDSALALYFSLMENHMIQAADEELEEDEKEDILTPLSNLPEL